MSETIQWVIELRKYLDGHPGPKVYTNDVNISKAIKLVFPEFDVETIRLPKPDDSAIHVYHNESVCLFCKWDRNSCPVPNYYGGKHCARPYYIPKFGFYNGDNKPRTLEVSKNIGQKTDTEKPGKKQG